MEIRWKFIIRGVGGDSSFFQKIAMSRHFFLILTPNSKFAIPRFVEAISTKTREEREPFFLQQRRFQIRAISCYDTRASRHSFHPLPLLLMEKSLETFSKFAFVSTVFFASRKRHRHVYVNGDCENPCTRLYMSRCNR